MLRAFVDVTSGCLVDPFFKPLNTIVLQPQITPYPSDAGQILNSALALQHSGCAQRNYQIKHLQRASAIECVDTACPRRRWRREGFHHTLCVIFIIEPIDQAEGETAAINARAILRDTPESSILSDHRARRPGRTSVNENWIAMVRTPLAEQLVTRK